MTVLLVVLTVAVVLLVLAVLLLSLGNWVAGLLLLSMKAGLFNLETLVVALPLLIVLVMAFNTGVDRIRRRSAEYHELQSYAAALRSTACSNEAFSSATSL